MVLLLPLPRRVLHQGVVPDALAACGIHQQAHRFELVVAGKDHRLDLELASPVVALLVRLHVHEARSRRSSRLSRCSTSSHR